MSIQHKICQFWSNSQSLKYLRFTPTESIITSVFFVVQRINFIYYFWTVFADRSSLQSTADRNPLQPTADRNPLQPTADRIPLQPTADRNPLVITAYCWQKPITAYTADRNPLQPTADRNPLQPTADRIPLQPILLTESHYSLLLTETHYSPLLLIPEFSGYHFNCPGSYLECWNWLCCAVCSELLCPPPRPRMS